MKVRTSLIGLLVVCGIGVGSISTAAAQPAGPPAGYNINAEFTEKSPDGAIAIEQYENKETDDYKWQFWVRWEGTFTQLDPEPVGLPAGFRFTNNLKWLVRMQKTGSASRRPICTDWVREASFPRPRSCWATWHGLISRVVPSGERSRRPPSITFRQNLLRGTEENYRWLGVDWPENRYLLIGLSGDADINPASPCRPAW